MPISDRHSSGPFSRVYFILSDGLLGTYTNQRHRLEPTGTLINTICNLDHNVRFADVYIETLHLIPHDKTPTFVVQRS